MRLLSIHVAGFGRICNAKWSLLAPRVNIFLGPNEAGKTTLLNFIHAMLAGYPRTWRQHYVPIDDVAHGGSLQFRAADGDIWVIRRTAGAKGGELEMNRAGRPVDNPERKLSQLLGHLSPETFRKIYTFGVDELHELQLLDIEDVNARIYSAGLGVPQLSPLLAKLQKDRDEIFTPLARKKEIIEAAERIQQIEKELERLAQAREEYEQIRLRLEAVDASLAKIDADLAMKQRRLGEAKELTVGYPIWSEIVALNKRLKGMAAVQSVPEEDIQRLDDTAAAAVRARQELAALSQTAAALPSEPLTPTQSTLLERDGEIEQLFAGRDSLENAQRANQTAREVLARLSERSQQLVAQVGLGWTDAAIAAFPATDALREEVLQFQSRFATVSAPMAEAKGELASAERRLQEAKETIARISAELGKMPSGAGAETSQRKKQAVREARKVVEGLRRIREERADASAGTNPPGAVAFWMFVVLGIVALTVAVTSASIVRIGAVAAAVVLFAIAVWLRRNAAARSVPASTSRTMSDETALRAAATSLRRELSLRDLTHEELDRIEDELSEGERVAQKQGELEARMGDADRVRSQCQAAVGEAAARVERCLGTVRELLAAWSGFVTKAGLPADTSPDAAVTLLDRLRAAGTAVREQRMAEEDLANRERALAARAAELQRLHAEAQLPRKETPLEQLDAIYAALIDARQVAERCRTVAAQREELESRLAEKRAESAAAEDALDSVLRELGAESVEDVRRRADEAGERRSTEQRVGQLITTLTNAVGTPEAFAARLEQFGELREETTEALSREIKAMSAERDRLRDERQVGTRRLEAIQQADCAAELLAEKEQLLSRVRTRGREWLVTTVALALLNETKGVYERERKPKVIEYAEGFFDSATGGTYRHISAPTGSSELTVHRHDQTAVAPENLSRGTLEQLYLALRLGFIRQLAEQQVTPPVVVDEILVNADASRAARIAEGLFKISETNQVLVFTCHRWVAELFRPDERPNEVRVIELEECA